MHEYVATSIERHRVVLMLATISFAASFGLGVLFHRLKLPSSIAPPTGALVFGAVFWLYNKYLWRWPLISNIPNLRGTWTGTVDIREGSNNGEAERGSEPETLACAVRITQTWLAMSIEFSTEKTRSHSVTAALGVGDRRLLHYEYDVTVEGGQKLDPNSSETAGRHFGTAHLEPTGESWDRLEGEYYNDRAFQRWGHYEITRNSRRTKG